MCLFIYFCPKYIISSSNLLWQFKYSHSNDLHVIEPSSRRSNDMGDVEKPPKPSRQNNGQTIIYPVEAHDTMVSVDHNMNSKGRVNHVVRCHPNYSFS
jgi:hypothetical protein